MSEPHRHVVLVVDDDDDNRRAMVLYLHSVGFEAHSARGGEDALLQLRDELKPCAMLVDIAMPGMDGWALVEKLRGDLELATIPVLLHSGYSDDPDRRQRLGVRGYLSKPTNPTAIAIALAEPCSRQAPTRLS